MQSQVHNAEIGASVLVDIRGAAQILGLSPWQIRGLISNKELPIILVGAKFYFRRATLTRWAEKSEGKHKAAA